MGLFSFVTAPVRFAFHLGGRAVGMAANRAVGSIAGDIALSNTRLQLRSYEGRALFDAKKLDRHIRQYHRIINRLMRFKGPKGGISDILRKLQSKFAKDPTHLQKAIQEEIQTFVNYYQEFLKLLSTIELEEGDMIIQNNAATIRDHKRMEELIMRIPEKTKTALVTGDFKAFLKELSAKATVEERREKIEYKERIRLSKEKQPVRGTAKLFSLFLGVDHLIHKVRKKVKKFRTHESRRFDEQFTRLRHEIETGEITPTTMARLRYFLENYEEVRKYYHEIDMDFMLIMGELFKDFSKVSEECVLPFYSGTASYREAAEIKKINEGVKEVHDKFKSELYKEGGEIKNIFQELAKLVNVCQDALKKIESKNQQIIAHVQQQMAFAK